MSAVEPQGSPSQPPAFSSAGIPSWMKTMAVVAAAVFALSVIALMQYPARQPQDPPVQRTALTPDYPGDVFQLSPFQLVDQDGNIANESIFSRRVTIASWVFSNCPLACPTIVTQMTNLQRDLADTNVQFIGFGLDPANDSPVVMKQWGDKIGVKWSNWKFLTEPHPLEGGQPAHTARALLMNDFKLHLEEKSDDKITLSDGSTMDNIIHPFEIYLLGPKGQMIAKFSAKRQEEIDRLRVRAREADAFLRGRAGGRPATSPDEPAPAAP
ncbi:MAG: SCO family protein [Phycisphaerales bacterium]|nr:SCO family protein [Phycisphaerales bacterium]